MPEPDPHAYSSSYFAHHPAPLVTATGVVMDRQGRVLVLTPSYKEHLELPGGLVENLESPEEGLARELGEELDLKVPVGRLLAVDSGPPAERGRALVAHIHAVGPLSGDQAARISFPDGEITAADWMSREAALRALPPRPARRLRAALAAWDGGAVAHLVDGEPQPGSPAAFPPARRAELEHAAALDPSSYLAARPKVVVGAAALLRDEAGRVLLVQAAYREDGRWQPPGGGVDSDVGETPRAAARRELAEETGLDRPLGRLLAVDFTLRQPVPALLVYAYDGGVLTAADLAAVRVDGVEIADWRLAAPDELDGLLAPAKAAGIRACLAALRDGGGPLELVAGSPPET